MSAPSKSKDFSVYFQPPSMRDAKTRGKSEINVQYTDGLPEEFKGLGLGKKYLLRTFGCQMNEHDSEMIAGLLEAMGYETTDDKNEADLILLNTCAVRENAEDKVFGELGHLKGLKREKPDLILGVCGCMSQEEAVVKRILAKHNFVDLIFGTHNIHRLPFLLKESMFNKELVVEVWSKEGDIIENLPKKRAGMRAWVNIMYGCDKFCTYCIVPYTRGKERSRLPQDVLNEVRELAQQGYQEVTLLGQNVNAYGKDFEEMKYGFGDLLNEIRLIGVPRIRFTTSHPRDFDDHLIEVLAKRGNLVEHIHLPVQSGSNEILKRMTRKYNVAQYLELVEKIRAAIPDAVLTTDFILGFPGETEEQFQETLELARKVQYDMAFTFIYSPREGTPAFEMKDDVPYEVKQRRLADLNEVLKESGIAHNRRMIGQVHEVLVESESKNNSSMLSGRTRTNKLVHFEGDASLIGKLVHVNIEEAMTFYLRGTMVEAPVGSAI